MSFYDDIVECMNEIECNDTVQIVGRHSYKGKLGSVKKIRRTGNEDIYLIEMQIDGQSIECNSSNLLKF